MLSVLQAEFPAIEETHGIETCRSVEDYTVTPRPPRAGNRRVNQLGSQRKASDTHKCLSTGCRERITGRVLYCWPCIMVRRRASNRRAAALRRGTIPADVGGPVLKIRGGHFQAMSVEEILRQWPSWQRRESEMV